MKEQAYNIIKTKDSRTQRQRNLNKFKEARFKISPREFEDHTLGEIVSLKHVFGHGSSESEGNLLKETSLRGDWRSFWDIPDKGVSSWNWKKILIIRGLIRDHIIHRVGDGTKTSLWFDNWHPICPFSNFISNWKIQYAGLSLKTKVADVVDNGKWIWPKFLSDEFYGLTAISPPSLINGKK
ncbi:hypothetical protein Tco_0767598 [Tanacetum coccineum]